jgi:hypothetical protein
MQAMDRNNVDKIEHLLKKAVVLADLMRTGFLSKNDAWLALTATIMKTMERPLATRTVNEAEWGAIMTPVLRSGLPRAGMDQRIQGFGIIHPWHDQEMTHLMVCLKQTLRGGMTGGLISASLEELRLKIGLPGWMPDQDFSKLGDLATDSWLKTV